MIPTDEIVEDAKAFFRTLTRASVALMAEQQTTARLISVLRTIQTVGHTETGCPKHDDCPELPERCPWSEVMDLVDATLREIDGHD